MYDSYEKDKLNKLSWTNLNEPQGGTSASTIKIKSQQESLAADRSLPTRKPLHFDQPDSLSGGSWYWIGMGGGEFTQVVLVFLLARCLVSGDFGHSDVRLLAETPLPCAALIGNKYVNKKKILIR